jgi:uncharacterized phiE125 gp8 family phage protein
VPKNNQNSKSKTMKYIPYLQQITLPVEEPISLVQAKDFLRVSGSGEDGLITRLIVVARKVAENYLRIALVERNFRLSLREELDLEVKLPMGLVKTIIQVKSTTQDNITTTIPSSNYTLIKGEDIVQFTYSRYSYLTEIEYTSGYGLAVDVPEDIKHGILLYIAGLYDERIDGIDLPRPCRIMFDGYRNLSI